MHGALVSTHGLLSGAEAARLTALGAGKWPEPLGRIAVKNDFVEIDGDPPPPKFLVSEWYFAVWCVRGMAAVGYQTGC